MPSSQKMGKTLRVTKLQKTKNPCLGRKIEYFRRRLPLRIYGVGGKLLSAIKSFYEVASACVKINGETSEHLR